MTNSNKNDAHLFLEAVKDARPLTPKRIHHAPLRTKPVPKRPTHHNLQSLADTLSDHFIPAYELELNEEARYLREGNSPNILRKLRRGHWPVQAAIDLHGLTSDEARLYVASFINDCKNRGIRCVRIVHGKGLSSRNQEPILKQKLRSWLIQMSEVIAYTQAKPAEGGGGAMIVLLKNLA